MHPPLLVLSLAAWRQYGKAAGQPIQIGNYLATKHGSQVLETCARDWSTWVCEGYISLVHRSMWLCPELVGVELELELDCRTEVHGVRLSCVSWVCGGYVDALQSDRQCV